MPLAVAMELECRDVGSLTGREGACQRFSRGAEAIAKLLRLVLSQAARMSANAVPPVIA